MADAKQDKNKAKVPEKSASSEGFGFKQTALGFDKNEVNLYINKLKKQMKEQQQEYENRISNLRQNLEDANDAKAAAKNAAPAPAPAPKQETDSERIKREKEITEKAKKQLEDLKSNYEAKLLEQRKLVLDERRNVAKLDKDCALAQMNEKKIRAEYEKLKEKYSSLKKSGGGGGKAVVNSNAEEVLAEACKLAESTARSANDYANKVIAEVNSYKEKVEAELNERSKKLEQARKSLDEQKKKAEADNAEAVKAIAQKISAITGQLAAFAGSFDDVNKQIESVTGQIDGVTGQLSNFANSFNAVNSQIEKVSGQITAVSNSFGEVNKSITAAREKISAVSGRMDGVSSKLSDTRSGFDDIVKAVGDTKSGIVSVQKSVREAEKLTAQSASSGGGADASVLSSISSTIADASGKLKIDVKLPEFKSPFDKSKLDELKKKLKVETSYEGGSDDDDELFSDDDDEIISSIEIDAEPEPVDDLEVLDASDGLDDGMDEDLVLEADSSLADETPLINMADVEMDDSFTLDEAPDLGDDFDIAPNDLTAAPEKGEDLGDDIFDMAIGDSSLDDMLMDAAAETKKKAKELDDQLAAAANDDFGEFADFFASGSGGSMPDADASTSKVKGDIWGVDTEDDSDMSSGTDLSDLSDLLI